MVNSGLSVLRQHRTEMDAMCRTDIVGTGRNKPLINPVTTEVALLGDHLLLVKRNGIV